MRILSVDWDYFFPDPLWYDWVSNEERGLFYEMAWSTRCNSRNLKTGSRAVDEFNPSGHEGFWGRLCPNEPVAICVTESHKDIDNWLDIPGRHELWNVDAHHDCGYQGSQPKSRRAEAHCGNWAWRMGRRIKAFHQVYPAWRRGDDSEGKPVRVPDTVSYSLDGIPPPHFVFVCRSSCWTPTWADDKWLSFVGGLSGKLAWTGRSTCPFVQKAREPSMEDAVRMAAQMDEFLKRLA